MSTLAGRVILLVEDEVIVATLVEDMLVDMGARVVGPATTVQAALPLLDREKVDAAVLDMNLNGTSSEPVARALAARGVPIVYTTGYGDQAKSATLGAAVLGKPYTQERLAQALVAALDVGGAL